MIKGNFVFLVNEGLTRRHFAESCGAGATRMLVPGGRMVERADTAQRAQHDQAAREYIEGFAVVQGAGYRTN
jgi:hypothetical protein